MSTPGLTAAEAAARLLRHGPNVLPEPEGRSGLRIALEVVKEPMLALLIVAGLIYLVLGELSDAIILVVFALFSVVVTIVQEVRTEHVLQSLRDLTSPQALVVRDGTAQRIPSAEVVPGDMIVLREGDRVPADAKVAEATDLQLDESLLTGESVPVSKDAGKPESPGDSSTVFSGTLVVRGTGVGEVIATGPDSQIGHIGQSLNLVHSDPPRLKRETRRLTITFGLLGALVSGLAILLYGLLRDSWLNAALAGIALGMSMLPEEFPVVLAVFMAMGAWRISHARVLTRRASAIETLGSATVLCTDKTGTLTQNKMVIAELRPSSGEVWTAETGTLTAECRALLRTGVLASAKDPFDPMERAFHALALASGEGVSDDWKIAQTYGLSPTLLAVTQAWQASDNAIATVAAKGAPEAIADLCRLSGPALEQLMLAADDMARRGQRVLAVATAAHGDSELPESPRAFTFTLLGLIGMADPLRQGVPEAVAQCHKAGIRVVMITGDHPETARAIGQSAGLSAGLVYTGFDLDGMGEARFGSAVLACDVFARIRPDQKLRIVEALKHSGEVVAMTGDGVNDAPSLKAADIGIAMGGRGTDVAREASSIVLLDDDFSSIVAAIRLGRRIYDNLRKAMGFILAVHIPIAGLALLPLLTGLPVLFWPVHIAFLEMIIDPVCSLVFEAEGEEGDVMRRSPRPPTEPLLPPRALVSSAARGAIVLLVVGGVYVLSARAGIGADTLRAMTFVALVGAILGLVGTARTFSASPLAEFGRPNPALLTVSLLVLIALGAALLVPQVTALFGFSSLQPTGALISGGAIIACLVALQLVKVASAGRPGGPRGIIPGGAGQ